MSPERNNFKELFREEELRFQTKQQEEEDNIASGLWRTLGFFKLIGQIVDMFIPKVFEMIIVALGGDPESMNDDEAAYPKPPSQGPINEDPRDIKPESPDNEDPPRGSDGTG